MLGCVDTVYSPPGLDARTAEGPHSELVMGESGKARSAAAFIGAGRQGSGLLCAKEDSGMSMITGSLAGSSPVLGHAIKWFLLKP